MSSLLPLVVLELCLLSFPLHTYAHGYLGKISIDGTVYNGPYVDSNPAPTNSTIRQVADISPVKGSSNDDLRCGLSAARAELEASAKAGSVVDFWWTGGGGQQWPHDTGPLMTYMAECTGVPDCTTFDPANAVWFKIDELGQRDNGASWWQQDFMSGKSLTVTLPNNLPTGHYLLRSEIIALHIAVSVGGAEFYPACAQLSVTGSGDVTPSPTVSFPGAYSDTDPGILVPDVFDPGFVYTFPGGAISNLAAPADSSGSPPAASNSSSSSGSSPSSNSTSSAPGAVPTSPADGGGITGGSGSTRTCKLAKRDATVIARRKRSTGSSRRNGIRHWAWVAMDGWMSW